MDKSKFRRNILYTFRPFAVVRLDFVRNYRTKSVAKIALKIPHSPGDAIKGVTGLMRNVL